MSNNNSRPSSSNGKSVKKVRVQENNDLVNLETETATTTSESPDELTFSDTTSQASHNDDRNSISVSTPTQLRARKTRERVGSEAPEHVKVEVNEPWTQRTKNKVFMITSLEIANFQLAVKYVITDTRRHKRAWLIGLVTVFLVVWFTSLLQNSISKSPIIFLKLSEDQVGEYDLVMTPMLTNEVRTFWINYTQVDDDITKSAPLVKGSVPRWVLLGRLANAQDTSQNTSTAVLIYDNDKEEDIGLGRGWHHRGLGENETHVTASVLRSVGVSPNKGEKIILQVDLVQWIETSGVTNGKTVSEYLTDLILQNSNITTDPSQNTTTLEEVLPQLQDALDPLGINATQLFEDQLGLSPNDTFSLDVVVEQLVATAIEQLNIQREYTVVDGIDSPGGKYPKSIGNVAMLESKYIYQVVDEVINNITNSGIFDNIAVLEAILPLLAPDQATQIEQLLDGLEQLNSTLQEFDNNFYIDYYAFLVVSMYKDRFSTYVKDQDGLNADFVVFTNEVSKAIGYDYPVTFTLPLLVSLTPLYFIRLFLDQIFTFVVVVLIVLGGLLIYSLLLSNVEEKTYEYGMLRSLGMKQYVLIELLISQSLSFSVPGILIGLLVSFLVFIPISYFISDYALSPLDLTVESSAIIIGVVLGLLMPFLAILGPINRALSRTLRDALDIYHQVQSETTVRVIKLEQMGLSPWQVSASVMMVVMGFVVYYIIPYSFTFGNLPLFFLILILILLGMLLGLSLIGNTLQPYAEKLALHLILWGEEKRTLHNLVRKNLAAHSRRNLKTAVMFTTALAFIIFAGTSFSLQGHTISDTVQLSTGSDIMVIATGDEFLKEDDIRQYLDAEMAKDKPLVRGYSFVTPALANIDWISASSISNLAGFPTYSNFMYGVESNYLDQSYVRFYQPTEVTDQFSYDYTSDNKEDIVYSLFQNAGQQLLPIEENGIKIPPNIVSDYYSNQNDNETGGELSNQEAYTQYIDVIVSEALRYSISIDTNTPLKITVDYQVTDTATDSIIYLAKARAMVKTFPGFLGFSSYRQTSGFAPLMMTMDQYYRIMNQTYFAVRERDVEFPEKPPKAELHVRLKKNPSRDDRESVINGIRNFIDDDLTTVIDTADLVSSTDTAIELLNLFFNIVSVIAVVLCFFVLWLSFTANIRENQWEFGVLRAVGLNAFKVVRIYIYEALALILSSVIIGSVIGMLVSITLTLQFNLFTELAFTFDFPYALFFSVLGMSLLVAVAGSYIPSYSLKKKEIALALKNL